MTFFPTLNACLNAASALLLITGWVFIRNKNIAAHRLCMSAAFLTSSVFLVCYLYYHYHVGSVHFKGKGAMRTLYFSILISHTTLAVVIVPLILRTLYLAARDRFEEHRTWAKRTFPLWLYVSATGVAVYAMLYRL